MWKRKSKRKETTQFNAEKIFFASRQSIRDVYKSFHTQKEGLDKEDVELRLKLHGLNEIAREKRKNPFILFCMAFANPFIAILAGLAVISLVIDVLLVAPGEEDWTSVVVITTMVVLSSVLRFAQEWRSTKASVALQQMVTNMASPRVERLILKTLCQVM